MYISDTDIENIVKAAKDISKNRYPIMIFLGEKNRPNLEMLVSRLKNEGITFFGGFFPGLIHDTKKFFQGAIIKPLPESSSLYLIKNIDKESEIPIDNQIANSNIKQAVIIILDGLSSSVEGFLRKLYKKLGNTVIYFGGGAGSLSLKQMPCIFSEEGVFQDAAIIVYTEKEVSIGVRHGWKPISGPYVATKTDKNKILTINWRPAFQVYKEIVESDSGAKLTQDNFFSIAKSYPFGICKEHEEILVRDPIAAGNNNELICVGEVPENAVLNILKGEKENLISAAAETTKIAKPRSDNDMILIADCISRVLFLEDDFKEEIEAIKKNIQSENIIPEGMLTLGEIASSGNGILEFYNKTTVICVLHE